MGTAVLFRMLSHRMRPRGWQVGARELLDLGGLFDGGLREFRRASGL